MTLFTFLIITTATLFTATLSGVLGMAGGMILMGVLSFLFPVATAMIVHGSIQAVSNLSRAWLFREHINWRGIFYYSLGLLVANALFSFLYFIPSKAFVFITLGLLPMVTFILPKNYKLDFEKVSHQVGCGLIVTATHLCAGVAGPLLDSFFTHTQMSKNQIMGTKACTQVFGHLSKLAYYGLLVSQGDFLLQPAWLLTLALLLILAIAGANLGKVLNQRLGEIQFKSISKVLILVLGGLYLTRGVLLLLAS